MDSRRIVGNVLVVAFSIVFMGVVMWYNPDKALELLFVSIFSVGVPLLLLRRAGIEERKDERTIHLMTLGGRNAFMFLVFAMPWLATFSIAGIILIEAFAALMILWIVAIAIAWVSFIYYYTR
jgi:hypothetical protein